MPTQCHWVDGHHSVVLILLMEAWNWTEYDQALSLAGKMVASTPHRVDFIVDMRGSKPPQTGAPAMLAPSAGLLVLVGGAAEAALLELFQQVYPQAEKRLCLARSLDEAIHLIDHERSQHPVA